VAEGGEGEAAHPESARYVQSEARLRVCRAAMGVSRGGSLADHVLAAHLFQRIDCSWTCKPVVFFCTGHNPREAQRDYNTEAAVCEQARSGVDVFHAIELESRTM
jgi:hypothetical protein